MITLPRFASSVLRLSDTAYANFGNPPVFSALKSFTLEAWVYPWSVTGTQTIIAKRNLGVRNDLGIDGQFMLFIADGRVNAWYPPENYLETNIVIGAKNWWHLTVVYDETTQTLFIYVNGEFAAKSQVPLIETTSSAELLVGAMLNGGAPKQFFQGLIGEVMIWNEARSVEDIIEDSVQISYAGDTAVPGLLLDYDCTTLPAADWSRNNIKAKLLQGANYSLTIPGVHLQDNAYINCGNDADFSLDGTKSYTIEGWFYPTSGAASALVSKLNVGVAGEYGVLYENDQVVSVRNVSPWSLASSASIKPKSFYHFATTYDEHTNVLRLYINGNLQGSLSFPATPDSNLDLLIGASYRAGLPANFFQGYIQNIRLWNVCLEQDEIRQWMFNQPVGDPTLIASFDFTVNPPVDATDRHMIQLINGAKIDALVVQVAPDSTEGQLGLSQSLNADYFNRHLEKPVAPPQPPTTTERAGLELIIPFTERHKAAMWQEIENRIRQNGGSGERIERARQGFDGAYREASGRVKDNPDLLKVFTIKDEKGMMSVTYHGVSGDVTILTAPQIDPCMLWWIKLDYHLTFGFLQALGLMPTVGDISLRVYNLLTRNDEVVYNLLSYVGVTITLANALGLLLLIYHTGLFWPILKMGLTSAGWWALARILQKILEICTEPDQKTAASMTKVVIWLGQLGKIFSDYWTACGVTEQAAAPTSAATV